jgi:hypothetical protein
MASSKMNPEVKALWLEALRSGKYKQATSMLCDGEGGYCCLGVLTQVYANKKKKRAFDVGGGYVMAEIDAQLLPDRVMKWAGLEDFIYKSNTSPWTTESTHDILVSKKHRKTLSTHNDDGKSFEWIADLIERHM